MTHLEIHTVIHYLFGFMRAILCPENLQLTISRDIHVEILTEQNLIDSKACYNLQINFYIGLLVEMAV